MIIESVRNYIRTCPHLQEFDNVVRVNVNYLDADADSYSIEEIPSEPILKKYVDGSTTRQYQFVFTSREPYNSDVLNNIDNSGFYQNFADWIEEQNNLGNLPIMDNGLEALEIKTTSIGYAFSVSEDTAQYQIQLRLKYLKK